MPFTVPALPCGISAIMLRTRNTSLSQTSPALSSQRCGQLCEIGHDEVGLMRRLAERPLPAIDERRPHAVGFRADAIEGMIGNEEDARAIEADDLGRLGIGLPVRLKIARLLHRNDVIEPKSDMWPCGLQHIAVTVREDCEVVSRCRPVLGR